MTQTEQLTLSQRALVALEWGVVRDALVARTRSPLGGALAGSHAPFPSTNESRRLRQRVLEGKILLEQTPVHGYVSGVIDVSELLDRAAREGVLTPAELWACGHLLHAVGQVGEEMRARKTLAPLWASDFALAPPIPSVCDRITRSVSGEGQVLDSASPDLARLRRQRGEKRIEFEATLNARIKDWYASGFLQDNFYDQVDGRYVVPVKVDQQSKLDGSLVGRSNTGQSVFIEPAELTHSNNALKEVDLAIRSEEFRILRGLSNEVGRLVATFLPWIDTIAELDLALSAARLAKDWELSEPLVPDQASPLGAPRFHDQASPLGAPRFHDQASPAAVRSTSDLLLDDVFHPGLILRENIDIVKNTFSLPAGGFGLLISGPNTGGKTVLLKAAALAACMARAGLLVPARKGSTLPHYADVFAFIGDEQNLAQGLSSFSAQIMDMKAVLEDKRAPLLIVIDEILSSTDPEEASALAQTLIEEFVARGHHIVVTSHFSELSLRAKLNPRIQLAAMEFEEGRPTYRLRPGELGSSHALEVASRLGFPERLLKRARELMSTAKLDYERAQAELKQKERDLELETARFKSETEREKESFKKELLRKLEGFMDQARGTVDGAVKNITDRIETYTRQGVGQVSQKTTSRLETAAKDAKLTLDARATELERELGGAGATQPAAALALEPGAIVKVRSMKGARGSVLEVAGNGAGQTAVIQVGNFRLSRPADDLDIIEAAGAREKQVAKNHYVGIDSSTESVPRKIDIRGKRYDEALGEAERYIDQAFRSGAAQVTVVTGHGTGALKKGLKELLANLPYVRAFRPEREGDDGATLIEFER